MAAVGFCFQDLIFIFAEISVSCAKTSQDCSMPEGKFSFVFLKAWSNAVQPEVQNKETKGKGCGFFYSKNSCDFIWAFFIVSATKRSTAKMFDRMVAFTEDIMRFWKSYLVTQGILCTRSPLSAPAYLIIQLPQHSLKGQLAVSVFLTLPFLKFWKVSF